MYYAVQVLTFAILVLAANTSYQGFPRLAAVLAKDRYFPRQFVNLGDRLVYSNGIVVLAGLASLLIWIFHANVISLIHLYVVGVFTAFTHLASGDGPPLAARAAAGMAQEGPDQRHAAALTTGVVTLLVIQAKFLAGAWMVTIAVPVLILLFFLVNRHYRKVARRLRAGVAAVAAAPAATNRVVLYVESFDAALHEAVWYAKQIAGDGFRAIHVPGPHTDTGLRPRFRQLTDIRPDLEIIEPRGRPRRRRDRLPLGAAARRIELRDRDHPGGVPPLLPAGGARPPDRVLAQGAPADRAGSRGQRRARDLTGPRLDSRRSAPSAASWSPAPTRRRCAPSTTLARSGCPTPKALFFAFDDDEVERIRPSGSCVPMRIPLEVEEAPFRDLGDPLLRYIRGSPPIRTRSRSSSCRS